MTGRLSLRFDLGSIEDAHQSLRWWLEEAEAGEMDGDDATTRLQGIVDSLDDECARLRRTVG